MITVRINILSISFIRLLGVNRFKQLREKDYKPWKLNYFYEYSSMANNHIDENYLNHWLLLFQIIRNWSQVPGMQVLS